MGTLVLMVRPDQRSFVRFVDCVSEAYQPLLAAAVTATGTDLLVEADQDDEDILRRYRDLGFAVTRREHLVAINPDPRVTGLGGRAQLPAGFDLVTADRVDPDRLRLLDDELRQDVPGAAGWQWSPEGFAAQTFDAADFDPAVYQVAVHQKTGRYAGLARVWLNQRGPRLGLIATVRDHRRLGLARALLAAVFAILAERGHTVVTAEVDETNLASLALLGSLGARRTGGTVEMVLPAESPR